MGISVFGDNMAVIITKDTVVVTVFEDVLLYLIC